MEYNGRCSQAGQAVGFNHHCLIALHIEKYINPRISFNAKRFGSLFDISFNLEDLVIIDYSVRRGRKVNSSATLELFFQ